MKICLVTTWPPHRDGVALYSSWLYSYLARLIEVWVIANIPSVTLLGEGVRGVEEGVIRCWKRGDLSYPLRVLRSSLKQRPNIIHLQHGWLLHGDYIFAILFPLLLLLLRLSRKDVVVTMHTIVKRDAVIYSNSLINTLSRIVILAVSRFIVKASSKVIVHNKFMKEVLVNDYALKREREKIAVIPHGVRETSGEPGISQAGKGSLFLSLGFIRESKGTQFLIEAFQKVLNLRPDAKLIIAGGSHAHDKKDYTEGLKRSLTSKICKKLRFTGYIDEKRLDEVIWRSDVVLLLSTERKYVESSGGVCRIASYAKPVICSRVPKFQSMLRDGENCVMIDTNNSAELTQAMLKLTRDKNLGKRLGKNLRDRFENQYWSSVAEQHFDLYKSLMKSS